jgi:hypothetical protein
MQEAENTEYAIIFSVENFEVMITVPFHGCSAVGGTEFAVSHPGLAGHHTAATFLSIKK